MRKAKITKQRTNNQSLNYKKSRYKHNQVSNVSKNLLLVSPPYACESNKLIVLLFFYLFDWECFLSQRYYLLPFHLKILSKDKYEITLSSVNSIKTAMSNGHNYENSIKLNIKYFIYHFYKQV